MTHATAIVSYIEPTPGYAREFNEWYERDHFPSAVLAGPGVVSGRRFVATRGCKALRPPGTLFGDPARGSYLALATLAAGRQADWDAWVVEVMKILTAQDRLFPHREHVHTAVYRIVTGALDLPGAPGVIAIADTNDVPPGDLVLELERTIVSAIDPPRHRLSVRFAADPLAQFTQVPNVDVGFASPFLATIPGTDTYTEEI
jgi:hypothetical protein